MKYHNANDQVTIDSDAAAQDAARIRAAIVKLDESKRSIMQLRASASGMHGETGTAITEQCNKLITEITELRGQLNGSILFINKTVQKYRDEDLKLSNMYQSGGQV